MNHGAGASAALRNVVKKIAARFRLPAFNTAYPSSDVDFMLGLALDKARKDAGLEEDEAEKLHIRNSDLRREYNRLCREKRLSDQAAERNFAEVERLKAENTELRTKLHKMSDPPSPAL